MLGTYPLGRAERQGGGPLSSSRDEPRRQTALDRGAAGQAKAVKLLGTDQRVEPPGIGSDGQRTRMSGGVRGGG
jgi:hypothetical protein